MYIRIKSTPNSPRRSVQIVEGYRDASGKVKQKIIRHLGVYHSEEEAARMVQLGEEIMTKLKEERQSSCGQVDLYGDVSEIQRGRPKRKDIKDILPVDKVVLDDLEEVDRVVEGVHDIGGYVYKDICGFDTVLEGKRDRDILKDIVLGRMVSPGSKRGLQKLLADQFDREHELDAIYRMMDKLHGKIATIKELCFNSTRSLLPNRAISLAFFDVTTLYFESTEEDALRAFGYSKDHRFNTTQLVLALATDENGLPLGYELFSGNTAEVKTLLQAIDSWKHYLTVKDICFVADRAMFTRGNLKALEASGYRYIVAAKLRTLKGAVREQVLLEGHYTPTLLGNQLAWVAELDYEGKRLITSYKSSRARNDANERRKVLEKITKNIGKKGSTKKLITNAGVKKYTTTQNSTTHLDDDKIARDAEWDGLHGVITNDTSLSASEVIACYARLWVIEQAFRINKHDLQMRPIFHFTPKRIESHIALCYMSFVVLRQIEYRVSLTQKLSPKIIMEALLGVQASILRHRRTKDLYRLPGVFKNDARKIYKTFNLIRKQDADLYLK